MEILIVLIIVGLPAAYMIWDRYFRVFPLSYFGIENVQRVAKWESDEWRERVFSRGGMTSREWISVNTRQLEAIKAELRRRQ
ncbi:hypothetical protein AI2834V1_5293 (plasmid) [Escherichia coli]|jgi:hypothetical protein|uniref:Uncharacterized protein n=1 Tax=Klebsiella pneumoniae TaxID=573 RepID=A0A483LUS6_KLEPN|nr:MULTISPECIES: hypothetical protein [Enterobacteriaceae]EAS4528863.1 hypothetical protein [Salmonella enterica]EBU7828335.1 hypothetical protein [Salmonella enterica subsp. enterica serovar Panama]EDC4039901.1 hypothetical protein [Salmonella enterica subsp. enterica serovar Mikawasima]EDH7302633.1 hypothetical protein [Salmonella enterica subsp. enterica serovar Newport]EDT1084312.1 hypothetical protein [Salmonella enterica subsp. enterica serovar Enteritidis]EHV5960340.1 hypothetical prot